MLIDSLTIVIPCKNEKYGIIESLRCAPDDVKIIVADSSNDKITSKLLADWADWHPNLTIIKGGLPSIARNNGFDLVRTPHTLFLDADIFYTKDVIYSCMQDMIHEDLDLVTCKFTTIEKEYRYIYRIFDLIQWFTAKTKPFALGGFMLFNSSKFKSLGGFNELDKVAEDYHLSSKIDPNKFKIINKFVKTSGRRFKNKGVLYMIKLALFSWLNRNNDEWFKNDQGYWA